MVLYVTSGYETSVDVIYPSRLHAMLIRCYQSRVLLVQRSRIPPAYVSSMRKQGINMVYGTGHLLRGGGRCALQNGWHNMF